jgi:hypothetical protein
MAVGRGTGLSVLTACEVSYKAARLSMAQQAAREGAA